MKTQRKTSRGIREGFLEIVTAKLSPAEGIAGIDQKKV